ncbi:response regulator transcription factor [Arthrobacter alkaliphilus]|uniref:response regulator n=1 Tax=Arthrobacter alkaliphilus TaxID=369936 RepID=UPI001F3AB1E6|nr:response regulator transcription factor [Arthrobacter alkaliphilus]
MEAVRVLIVDDEALVRHALRIFLEWDPATAVAGEAVNGIEAVEQYRLVKPDVVLMDLQMPVMNGVEATETITAEHPEARVLAVTTFSSESHVIAALRAGASGYLVKDTHPDEIVSAILDVHADRSVLSPRITRGLITAVRDMADPGGHIALASAQALTERELSIVKFLAQGLSNAEIANALYLSEATVKSNLGRIMNKWGARDRVQVLIHAVRTHLVTL